MTTLLFSVLAATSLAAAGIGVPSETRSAQSLPNEHLVVAAPNAASSGKLHNVNRLVDAAPGNPDSDTMAAAAACKRKLGHWNEKTLRCNYLIPVYIIGAGATAGFIYALTSHGSPSGQPALSH